MIDVSQFISIRFFLFVFDTTFEEIHRMWIKVYDFITLNVKFLIRCNTCGVV